jgi:hypothetical protein
MGMTFDREEVRSYPQLLETFKPSTLTLFIPQVEVFWKYWLHPELIEIIENYMGLLPFLQEAYLRRNFPAKHKVMNHFWHRDTNHKDYLVKIFFFFTDCKVENGPHEYVLSSVKDRRLDGRPYFTDEEIDSLYPLGSEKRVKSVVKAGTVIIEDTRGLHRAVVPREGYRDLGYAVFMPQAFYHRWGKSTYQIESSQYNKLDDNQKSYIPDSFIKV